MPIVDERQGGVRRYAIFTFVMDGQGGKVGSPALRFPQSPHASSLEASTRLRHCDSFFMKRLKSLEKGLAFPFVDISFFSTYQHVEEMKRLIGPRDCVNFHDAAIQLQKGCYEEVQLVDPKRDMIQTPIDDDDVGSGSGSTDANRNEPRTKQKVVHPPGIQSGADDYKKTRGYILIAYKTMEYMYSREFLSSWKTWTGVRYICMQMPRQLGLRRIAFYRQLSCTSDFSYVLLIEVTNLLLYAAQTLNLMDRIKLRLCGCAGVFREIDFQVDPVTANVHHISTSYRPPEKPLPISSGTTLGRVDSVGSLGSAGEPLRKNSGAQMVNDTGTANDDSANVDTLMQLLKQQQEAAAKRKAAMDAANRARKRHSLAPPDNAPTPAPETVASISGPAPTAGVSEQQKTETLKKAPTAVPESEDSDIGNGSASADQPQKMMMHSADKRVFHNQQVASFGIPAQYQVYQQQQPSKQLPQQHSRPMYHTTAPAYPVEMPAPMSAPIPQPQSYYSQYHDPGTLPMHQPPLSAGVYGQILTQPLEAIMQNREPMIDMIANDYHPVYTYTGQPIQPIPFGLVQPTGPETAGFSYNSPVYSRTEWKNESASYGGRKGEESMRNLAEQFRSLRETPIVGSDPYLVSSTHGINAEAVAYQGHVLGGYMLEDGLGDPYSNTSMRRERSHSAAFVHDPVYMRQQHRNHTVSKIAQEDRPHHDNTVLDDPLQQKMQEAERLKKKIVEAGKFTEAEKLQQKIAEADRLHQQVAEADSLQQKIADAERLQQKIAEAERIQQKLAIAEFIQQKQLSAETERLKQKILPSAEPETLPRARRDRVEKQPHRQKSAPKLDDTTYPMVSPPLTRRMLPKLPPHDSKTIGPEETEVEQKRHHEKRSQGLPMSQKETHYETLPRMGAKELVDTDHKPRHRARNLTRAEKHNPKEASEMLQQPSSQLQQQPAQHREQPNNAASSKIKKASPSDRSKLMENDGDVKAHQTLHSSASGRGARSPPGTVLEPKQAAGATEGTSHRDKPRSREETKSRSRSRDNAASKTAAAKPSTSTNDGPSSSIADQHHKPKVDDPVVLASNDKSVKVKSSKARESPRKR